MQTSNGFLDTFIIVTNAVAKNRAKFIHLVIAENNGCYLEEFYLEETKDKLQINANISQL